MVVRVLRAWEDTHSERARIRQLFQPPPPLPVIVRFFHCPVCGALAGAIDKQTRYCRDRCRWAGQQRTYRAKKKQASQTIRNTVYEI